MTKQRILHVTHGFPPESHGGIESYVSELLRGQSDLGHEVRVLHGSFEPREEATIESRDDLPWPASRLHRDDAYADYWDRAHHAQAGTLFAQFLRDWRPDVVHVHQWIRLTNDLVALAEAEGVATVVTLHDLSASCAACFRQRPNGEHCERILSFENCADCVPVRGHESEREIRLGIELFGDSMRSELRRARRILAATAVTADLVRRGLALPELEIAIEPLGYTPRFSGVRVPELRIDEREPLRLAYWGNVTARKGVDTLLEALQFLQRERDLAGRLELVVFGRCDSETLHAKLVQLAQGLPVRLHGRYEWQEIADFAPHVAVFPSDCFETYGFVLDEAFELGRPALVTGVGAFAERIGTGGWTVPPGEPRALADAIRWLLAAPNEVLERSRQLPAPGPGIAQHTASILKHYEQALATAPGPDQSPGLARRLELEQLRRDRATLSAPTRRGWTPETR